MAITNVRTVQRVEVYPPQDSTADAATNAAHETVMVVYMHTFDDKDDAELPVSMNKTAHLSKFDSEGKATVYSSEDALVKTICAAIWA